MNPRSMCYCIGIRQIGTRYLAPNGFDPRSDSRFLIVFTSRMPKNSAMSLMVIGSV